LPPKPRRTGGSPARAPLKRNHHPCRDLPSGLTGNMSGSYPDSRSIAPAHQLRITHLPVIVSPGRHTRLSGTTVITTPGLGQKTAPAAARVASPRVTAERAAIFPRNPLRGRLWEST